MWIRLIFKEMLKRKWGFALSVTAIAISAAAVALVTAVTYSMRDEVRRITRDQQQNIEIIPGDIPPEQYMRGEYGENTMPEELVEALVDPTQWVVMDPSLPQDKRVQIVTAAEAEQKQAAGDRRVMVHKLVNLADHYVAELQALADARSASGQMRVTLTGQRPEEGLKKEHPITRPPRNGEVRLGSAVAERLDVAANGKIEIQGRTFTVVEVADQSGTPDDVRVYASLDDVQQLLGKPGRINRVLALSCLCEFLSIGQVASVLETRIRQFADDRGMLVDVDVVPMTRKAAAREKSRRLVNQVALSLTPVLAIICAALVGAYFYFNIRERQQEIGVMLAIGYTPLPIVAAVLVKLLLVSLIGGVIGTYAGIALSHALADPLLLTRIVEPWYLVPLAMGSAVVLTLLAGIYPLLVASTTEAADILRNA